MIIKTTKLRTFSDSPNSGLNLQKRVRSVTALLAFVAFAFAWSWVIGFAGARIKGDFPMLSSLLLIAAGFGPSLAGLIVVTAFSSRREQRDWIARSINWRMDWRWFALSFLLPPAIMLVAVYIDLSLGGAFTPSIAVGQLPLLILNFALVLVIGGPLGEEFGWRGYAMPALQARVGWRLASLIIGVVWGVWHLPLFFLAGTAQSQMPIAIFMFNIMAGSVLFGWLYQKSKGSVLPVIVLHTSLNAWSGILILVPTAGAGRTYALVTGFLVVVALALMQTSRRTTALETHAPKQRSSTC